MVAADVNSGAAQETVDMLVSEYFSFICLIGMWLYMIIERSDKLEVLFQLL